MTGGGRGIAAGPGKETDFIQPHSLIIILIAFNTPPPLAFEAPSSLGRRVLPLVSLYPETTQSAGFVVLHKKFMLP